MAQILHKLIHNGERIPDFYYDVETEIIYLVKSIAGKKEKISSGIKRPNVIQAKREAHRKLKLKLNAKKVRITPLIKDLTPKYLKIKESENLDLGTMKNIRQALIRIEGFWGDKFPSEITRENLAEWYLWLEKKYPGQLKEKPIKYMRNFAIFLAETQHNGMPLLSARPKISDPDLKEVKARRQKKKERIFTSEEFKIVYGAGNEVEKTIAMFMSTMATRIEETVELSTEEIPDIFSDRPIYRWRVGQNKADQWGHHYIHPANIELLRARLKASGGTLFFPQKFDKTKPLKPQQIDWADWRERANLGWHWTSHTFRHYCLTRLFNDPRYAFATVCKLYRVSPKVAMETYVHVQKENREKMRDSLEVDV